MANTQAYGCANSRRTNQQQKRCSVKTNKQKLNEVIDGHDNQQHFTSNYCQHCFLTFSEAK